MSSVENKESLEKQVIEFTKQLENADLDDTSKATILLNRATALESLNLPEKASQDARFALNLNSTLEPQVKQLLDRLNAANATSKPQDPRVILFQQHLSSLEGADTAHIRSFVSSSDFVSILTACGTVDTPPRVKSLAFMILTKLFNPASAEKYPFTYIIEQCAACFSHCVDQGKNEAKLLAYNTLIAIFQTSMTVGSAILCQEGTIEEMMDIVEFETVPVQLAVAQVLTIASSDKSCRTQILKYAVNWLVNMAGRSKTDPQLKAAAGTALTKLKAQPNDETTKKEDQPTESLEDTMRKMHLTNESLVDSLQQIIKSKSSDANLVLNAVEGLAYACLKPDIKDKLGKDAEFLKCLSTLALSTTNNADANSNPLLFGIGTIFSNLTMYRPVMDEQQKQMKKLRDLANAKQQAVGGPVKDEEDDPRENDDAVESRIKLCVSNGAALALMVLSKNTSVNLRAVAAQTYFNLVTPQSVRGQLLQQGIVKGLLPLSRSNIVASQALAKLAITADPRIAFQGDTVLDLVRPFLELCKDANSQLRQFEGLMALTNLASIDDRVRLMIEDADGMSVFENLQLSNNDMVQRAATEMVCNMTFCDPVFERYSDPNRSQNRIRLLMILSDGEDPATRRAASGALAILANSPSVCDMMLKVDKCYERIARWVDEEETVDVQHRGVEIIRCLITHQTDVVSHLVEEQVDKKLITLVKDCQVQVVRSAAMEVLKLFVANGVKLQA
ncbi:armadillo-type protein [Thamnidium elegans]|uniref:UNC-45/Cro1/She4 central domain-containing protein n=1 Tax=Thamnidium elegans TaxID=101142 RepID=A0A8H7SSK2_9FUNG|nr:hypothetical protein INT48_007722 [Thamnidium elegans]KAI8080878.1 armadillo-type protein [Thamnidium elegans]